MLKIKSRKNLIKLGLCFAFGSVIPSFSAYAEISMEGIVTADVLNVRQEANATSTIVTSLKKGSKIKIINSNDDKTWYQVSVGDRKGWVSKSYLQINVTGDVNYKNVSTLGNPKDQGILNDAVKIASNNKYKYVIDNGDKTVINIYDFNNTFISSVPMTYYWATDKNELKNIVLTADNDMNFYTNNTAKNVITKYDMKGLKLAELKADVLGEVGFIAFDQTENILYVLDTTSKSIKGFNAAGESVRNIFLSETRVPKSFAVNNGKIFVLDYPENEAETYQVYYVNSLGFNLRSNYDPKASIVESLPKGSILKNNPSGKTFTAKTLLDDDPSKIKISSWIDFSEGSKKYGLAEELKKTNALGEIDIYRTSGEPQFTFSLNQKWTLKTPDRHRVVNTSDLTRIMKGVAVDKNNNVIVPILTKIRNTNVSSINYYYFNTADNSYKISQSLPFDDRSNFTFSAGDKDVYTVNSRKYVTVINENGVEKESLGRISPYKYNLASKLYLNNNRLYMFDKGSYSFGEYDLNGDPVKVRYIDQSSDLFEWSDVSFTNNNIALLKTLNAEEKKIGFEIYNSSMTKTFDKFVITPTIDNNVAKIAVNDNKEVLIAAKGYFYNKKVFLTVFNDKGYLINNWANEFDLINLFPEEARKAIRENSLKFLGFDADANMYLLLADKASKYRIEKLKINTDATADRIKSYTTDFFDEVVTIEPEATEEKDKPKEKKEKITKREFPGSIKGDILSIETGKNGFTYFLYRDTAANETKLGIYDVSGNFWKDFSLKDYPGTAGFTLDNQDNVWISQGTSIRKLATY